MGRESRHNSTGGRGSKFDLGVTILYLIGGHNKYDWGLIELEGGEPFARIRYLKHNKIFLKLSTPGT